MLLDKIMEKDIKDMKQLFKTNEEIERHIYKKWWEKIENILTEFTGNGRYDDIDSLIFIIGLKKQKKSEEITKETERVAILKMFADELEEYSKLCVLTDEIVIVIIDRIIETLYYKAYEKWKI